MLIDVIRVKVLSGYKLELEFENGETREFNAEPLFSQKPFDKLIKQNLFQFARVQHGTVTWPGNIDIAPETLYLDSKLI